VFINTSTTKFKNMKHIFLFLFLASALPAFGQQDSVTYEKRVNTSETYKGDSIYYKLTYTKQGEVMTVRVEPFTDQDSLMGNVLYNEFTDASRQYKQALLTWEEQERGYLLRLRQAERDYKRFTGTPIKDKVESEFDFTELLGEWLLNGKAITIDAKLEIGKKPIKILSDQQFTVEIDKEQRVFNRIKAGRWIAKDERYKLERPGKLKNKK
jgi:hypothetical protein